MVKKYVSMSLFAIYALFFLTQLFQFLSLANDFNGPYAFLMSMALFNVMFLALSKKEVNLMALLVGTFYFIWYTVVFYTIQGDNISFSMPVNLYYFFFRHAFDPSQLIALSNYFSTAIAVSVYLIPWLFIINFNFLKQYYQK